MRTRDFSEPPVLPTSQGLKRCSKCAQERPLAEFNWNRFNACFNPQCIVCRGNEQRRRNSTREGRIRLCVTKARNRSWECSLTVEEATAIFVRQRGRCALTGERMTFHSGDAFVASLDRIESTRGYHADNVRWVLHIINNMRQHWSDRDFVLMCHVVAARNACPKA